MLLTDPGVLLSELVSALTAVWSPIALIVAIVGGLALGLGLGRFENPRFDAVETFLITAILGAFVGAVFYSGQAIETLLSEGPLFAARVVSRFFLWVMFCVAIGVGSGLRMRVSRGQWRDTKQDQWQG